LEVNGVKSKVSWAYLLSDAKHAPLTFSQSDGTLSVELAGTAPDHIATVICLECANDR
jgi:hypothetical protein